MKKFIYPIIIVVITVSATVFASSFTDLGSFSDWYKPAVINMQTKEIVKGYPDGSFGPSNSINRAELTVMFDRYDNYLRDELIPHQLQQLLGAMHGVEELEKTTEISPSLYRSYIIMAEAGFKRSSAKPIGITEVEGITLPDGYTIYQKTTSPATLDAYVNYKGDMLVGDIIIEGEWWYGPY